MTGKGSREYTYANATHEDTYEHSTTTFVSIEQASDTDQLCTCDCVIAEIFEENLTHLNVHNKLYLLIILIWIVEI